MAFATSEAPMAPLSLVGELAAEAAHELKNLLQVIATSAYLARQDGATSADHLLKIERTARLAQGIVDDLMDLARGEAASLAPTRVAEVVCSARLDFAPGEALWRDELDPETLTGLFHPRLAARLLHALYENAIQASKPRPPTVTTRARADHGTLQIEVADDGPGVPEGLAPRIFEPLVTGRRGGSGLGLALARRIASAHHGHIELLPAAPGATFRITLPSFGIPQTGRAGAT